MTDHLRMFPVLAFSLVFGAGAGGNGGFGDMPRWHRYGLLLFLFCLSSLPSSSSWILSLFFFSPDLFFINWFIFYFLLKDNCFTILCWFLPYIIPSSHLTDLFYVISTCAHAMLLQSCPSLCDPMDCDPSDSSVHGKNTGVGCRALLQGVFLNQRSNLHLSCLLNWQEGSLPLTPPGN